MDTMIAARLHQYGAPMTLDRIPVPQPRPTDVLVEVKACGIVPNLQRVISNFFVTQSPERRVMPELPAIFGLDSAGVVAKVGDQVRSIRPGERVYVNPARSCGSCRMCRSGQPLDCPVFTFQGYFGRSQDIMRAYPYGGLCQFITAPVDSLVRLPESLSFEAAARFGYFGTAYSAMKKLGVGPGHTLLVNGISGTLGLCAALLALAMGGRRRFSERVATPRCWSASGGFRHREFVCLRPTTAPATRRTCARRPVRPTPSLPGLRRRRTATALTA